MEPTGEPPAVALKRLVNGYRVSQAIHVAVTLGIADLLKDGPRSSADLAAATGAHPGALYRLLRALASVGIFAEEPERRFALTPLGAGLRADAEEPVGPLAAFIGRPYHWRAWADLLHSVRTGENAMRHVHGMSSWDYRAQHPEEGAIFDAAMTANTRPHALAVFAAYDFGRFGCVVDVGGGQGAFLAAILIKYPTLQGVLFDQSHVVARAEAMLRQAGVAERCRVVSGSFFETLPTGGDAYILKFIIHDWEDEQAIAILRACRQAMSLGGTLLVLERVISLHNQSAEAQFSDLNMLVGPGGQERTQEEYANLLAHAGFSLIGVIPTGREISVIEGVAV